MPRPLLGLALLPMAALTGCTTMKAAPVAAIGNATLVQANGLPAGTALFTAANDRLSLHLAVAGLPPGGHGVHLHSAGKCGEAGFTDAGAHLSPASRQHGTDNPAGSHFGDLPNLMIGADGTGILAVQLPGSRDAALAALFDGDGSAVVIHAALDDYRTDPSGNSGARIACGVLQRK